MFSETYGVTSYGSGWWMDVVNGFLEFVIDLTMIQLEAATESAHSCWILDMKNWGLPTPS